MSLKPVPLRDVFTTIRASEGSTCLVDGSISFVSAETARYWFDPAIIGRRLGLLIEPSRTNLFLNSLDNSLWSRSALDLESGVGIKFLDKVSNVKLATASATAEWHQFRSPTFQAVSGSSYTGSFFAKAGSSSIFRVALDGAPFTTTPDRPVAIFDLSNGTIVSVAAMAKAHIEKWKDGWYRCSVFSVAGAAGSATSSAAIGSSTAPSAGTMYICGGQWEAGQGASSLIRTTAAQGTRAADLIVSNTIIAKYLGETESTVVANYYPGYGGAPDDINVAFWARDKAQVTTNLMVIRRRANGISEYTVTADSPTPDASVKAVSATLPRASCRMVAARNSDEIAISFNGAPVTKASTGLHPKPDQIILGSAGNGQYLCGVLASIKIIPKRIQDDLMRAIQ